MSSSAALSAARAARPPAVVAAVALTVFLIVGSVPFYFAPGADDVPAGVIAFSIVAGVAMLAGAWGLWNLRRWGAVVTFVLTLLNAISAVPGLVVRPSGWIVAEIVVAIPLSIIVLVLIALPSARRAYR